MLIELRNLLQTTVNLQIHSTTKNTISYEGTLVQVNEDTNRFVIQPQFVCTTINNRIYHAQYNKGPLTIGFDIDDIETIDTDNDLIILKE